MLRYYFKLELNIMIQLGYSLLILLYPFMHYSWGGIEDYFECSFC